MMSATSLKFVGVFETFLAESFKSLRHVDSFSLESSVDILFLYLSLSGRDS